MISLTVQLLNVTKGIASCAEKPPHIHVGIEEDSCVDFHIGIALDPYSFPPGTTHVEQVSLQPKKRGSRTLHGIKERRDDTECALVLINIPPGHDGSTLWTAATKPTDASDWPSFPQAGITVLKHIGGRFEKSEYQVCLLTMDPESSFRIYRTGKLADGEPRELFYAWVDGELRCGTVAKDVVP